MLLPIIVVKQKESCRVKSTESFQGLLLRIIKKEVQDQFLEASLVPTSERKLFLIKGPCLVRFKEFVLIFIEYLFILGANSCTQKIYSCEVVSTP